MAANNRFYLAALVAVAVIVIGDHAFAQETRRDGAGAEALFSEAKRKMEAGNYAEACLLLEESQRLDPGGGTLLNLAVCHEKEGKTASAWAEFQEALLIARNDRRPDRAQLAEERVRELEPKLSRLTIKVAPSADADGLAVKIDSVSRARVTWDRALPIDPGLHTVSASANGRKEWSGKINVGANADAVTVEIPPLEQAEAPTPVTMPVTTPATQTESPEPAPASGMGTGQIVGLAVAGAGVVALGVGGFFGLRAIDKDDASDLACTPRCTKDGEALNNEAKSAADISTVSVGIGLAAIAVGGVLFFTSSPSKPRSRTALVPTATAREAGLVWRGVW
jgi:hypothetical protein